jgi:hypothetical protein
MQPRSFITNDASKCHFNLYTEFVYIYLQIESLAKEVDQNDPLSCKRGKEFDGMTMETYINQTMWMAGTVTYFMLIRKAPSFYINEI